VGAALAAAPAAGLVPRDVKPANVLLAGEHAYLSDFGLTRLAGSDTNLTESGRWIGTVEYCSPEQLRGDRTDALADVYSLGCVLFAALTGTPPFAHGTVPATMLAHLHDLPPRPSERGAPAEFDRVLARALEKDPDRRYPSAGDLGRAALGAARGEPVTESERSVARGSAAPESTGNGSLWSGNGGSASPRDDNQTAVLPPDDGHPPTAHEARTAHEEPTEREARDARTALDDRPEPRIVRARRWPARLAVGATAFILLVAVGLIAGQIFDDPRGAAARTGPLSEDEVRDAAQAFADAYAAEDAAALGRTVTRDAVRVLPAGRTQGRDQIVEQYERQFDGKVGGYELEDLEVTGGRAGRATGRYRVERDGGDPIEGEIVFGVVRDRGRPRIELIAATPTS
jgi:ketosteroid isomerase-like protein